LERSRSGIAKNGSGKSELSLIEGLKYTRLKTRGHPAHTEIVKGKKMRKVMTRSLGADVIENPMLLTKRGQKPNRSQRSKARREKIA